MATMNVLDAAGVVVALEKPLAPGRVAAATSRPVALSTEDLAVLSSIDTKLTTLAGYVDGLEALATTLNGYVDGIEALIGTTNTSLSGISGYVDGLETLNTTLNGYVDGLEALVGAATPAGSNLIGRTVADASAADGGIASTARLASAAASTNAARVKASAGRIYCLEGKNNAAYDVFLVIYDSASDPPVPGTTMIRKKMICPAGQAFIRDYPLGLSCATGIGFAFTKLVADADTTVLAAADITAFNMDYV